MELANRFEGDTAVIVPVEGHILPLYCSPTIHWCGEIENGVSFEFGSGGTWVIDLDVLREIVDMADDFRFKRAKEKAQPTSAM